MRICMMILMVLENVRQRSIQLFKQLGVLKVQLENAKNDKRTGNYSPNVASALDTVIASFARVLETFARTSEFDGLLQELANPEITSKLNEEQLAMVREMRISHAMDTALPAEMALKAKSVEVEGRAVHAKAMEANDWDAAKEWLRDIIFFQRDAGKEYADKLGLEGGCLDGMLAVWSPGFTREQVDDYFSSLKASLGDLIPKAVELQAGSVDADLPGVLFDRDKIVQLNEIIARKWGVDFERGGFRYSGNAPIEGGTRDSAFANLKEPSPKSGKPWWLEPTSAVHEGAHERYIQNTLAEYKYTPLGEDLGGVMHEGVALLSEMVIGRTREYYVLLAREMQNVYGVEVDPDTLYSRRNKVALTPDRKTADELTYHLHVIARWQAYTELMENKVTVDDYPERLKEIYKDVLGLEVDDAIALALSDVHLFVGKGALYPSYTLGHGLACQFFEAMKADMPDMLVNIAKEGGEGLLQAHEWMKDRIFSAGRCYEMNDLVKRVTGKEPNAVFQLKHLRSRFLPELQVVHAIRNVSVPNMLP